WRCVRLLELEPRVGDVVQTTTRIFRERATEQGAHACGCGRGQTAPVDVAFENRRDRFGRRRASEGATPREHLVEHARECPYIAALIDRQSLGLLRTHVSGGAQNRANLGLAG